MRTIFRLFMLTLVISLIGSFMAHAESKPARITASAAYQKLKSLVGDWTGTVGARGQGESIAVSYRVTSAGHAVVETLFPSSQYEMVTVYHPNGDKLVLTHYWAAGNQPRMALTRKSTAETLDFDFVGRGNMKSKKDEHMHAARIRFVSPQRVQSRLGLLQGWPEGGHKEILRNAEELKLR